MSRIIIPCLFSLFILPSLLPAQAKFNLVGGTTFDFGELYSGKVQKNLSIINDGNDTLIISNVSASCGCTGTLMSNDHIAPHDSGALLITFDTKKARGQSKKAVSLETNDPDNKKVHINFTANVIPIIDLEPEYIYFQGKEGSSLTQELVVKNQSSKPISFQSVVSSLDNVSAKMMETTLSPGKETKLTCILSAREKGLVKGTVTVKTDNAKMPVLEISIHGLVTAAKTSIKAEKN